MAKHHSVDGAKQKSSKTQQVMRTCLIIIAIMGISLQISAQQPPASVVILPFEIFSEKDLSYLQTEIPAVLKKSLEQAGARVLLLDALSEPEWRKRTANIEEIKQLSLQTGADYVLWGSLTWIGQQFSLDLKLSTKSPIASRPMIGGRCGKSSAPSGRNKDEYACVSPSTAAVERSSKKRFKDEFR